MEECLGVVGGGCQGLRVRLPGEGPQLRLHLRGAARHSTRADLQVDPCNRDYTINKLNYIINKWNYTINKWNYTINKWNNTINKWNYTINEWHYTINKWNK